MLDVRTDWKSLTSAEKIVAVRPLVAQGLSSTQIAALFRNVSRNSIIGLCHRTGMKLGGNAGRVPTSVRPAAPKKPARTKGHSDKAHGNKGQPKVAAIIARASAKHALPPQPVEMLDLEDGEGVDVTHLVGIMDLERHSCRWPMARTGANTLFCGAWAEHGPYCPEHSERSAIGYGKGAA